MAKVFLSHSSSDKEWYVDIVYKRLVKVLGEDSVIIDNMAFQEGRKTIEEIYYQLERTDLFVIFLSNKALCSSWVQNELIKVENLVEKKKINQICPIIIDEHIKYDDDRIPLWMKKAYNIQRICSQVKASNIIRQRMIEISYKKHPKLKERNLLFVGRNEFLQKFEERIDDFEREMPIVIMASGLEGIGRKTFLRQSLFKSNIVKDTYPFSTIVLQSDESIEDCILKLYDLGLVTGLDISLKNIVKLNMDEKINLFIQLIVELQKNKEIIFIVDNGCIVSYEGKVATWFVNAIQNSSIKNKVTFLLACQFRYFRNDYNADYIYSIALPELDVKERNGLLKRCLELEGIDLNIEQIKIVSGLLSGYPEQVFFAVMMIKEHGWDFFFNNSNDVANFNFQKAAIMLQDVRKDTELMDFLVLISSFDYISIGYILSVTSDINKYTQYVELLYNRGICEYVGALQEYIRVNDTVKDYLQRSEYRIVEKYQSKLKENVKGFINEIDEEDYDIPELLHSLKMSLVEGIEIDSKYIIPSIYLKTMSDLYKEGKYKEVTKFADKALQSSSFIDDRIIFELRYLLCSALAKLKDPRFKDEVMSIEGADHDFLFGFYYRQIGKFDKALERINCSLEKRENFSKAKREKVQAYIGMQDYDSALELARINYINSKENPYHIQAYFTCVIKTNGYEKKKDILLELIRNMENIGNSMSKELTLRFRAQYAAFIENDYDQAIEYINQAIKMNKRIHYAELIKFDIAERFNDIDTMQEIVDLFKKSDLRQRYSNNIVCMEAVIQAELGDVKAATEYFKMNVKNYTDSAKDRFIVHLNRYNK